MRDVRAAAEHVTDVGDEAADVGARTSTRTRASNASRRRPQDSNAYDRDRPRLEVDVLAARRALVGALAADLDRGDRRRHLFDLADEPGGGFADLARRHVHRRRETTSPSASSVVVRTPSTPVTSYIFGSPCTYLSSRVAGPDGDHEQPGRRRDRACRRDRHA